MESLFGLNSGVLIFLVVIFYLLAVGQALHVAFVVLRRELKPVWVFVSYEILLFVHLVLSTAVAESALKGLGQPSLVLWSIAIPLDSLLWINAVVFLFGAVLCIAFRRPTMIAHLLMVLVCTPPFLWILRDFWWFILILDASLFLFRGISTLTFDIRGQSIMVSRLSIIEALNAFPEGLLYADDSGRAMLMNDAMRASLIRIGLPTDLADTRALWDALRDKANMGYAPDALLPEGVRLRISEQEIRLFTLDEAFFHRRRFRQIFAIDVTEEEHLNFDIEQTNYLLQKAGNELQESLEDLREATENEVLLCMRSRVHDIVGQRLSILHRYLEDGYVSHASLGNIRLMLNTILDDLVVRDTSDHATDLAAVVDAFSLVGVEVVVAGELPAADGIAEAFVDIIREAATNAAKHAQASLVSVTMEKSDAAIRLKVTNDGLVVEGPIREGKGLPGMRYAAERVDGSFGFYQGPPFVIQVEIPRKEEVP